jgi:hypothetical protein
VFRNKLEKRVAAISLLIGVVAGSYQYLPDINRLAFGNNNAVWEDTEIDAKALASTPPLEGIINLATPLKGSSLEEWSNYLDTLDQLEGSHELFGRSNASKLGALYAQVALEKPEVIYQRLNNKSFDLRKAANLLEAGLLSDWYENVNNPDVLLLENINFTLSYVASQGAERAKKQIIQAFFNMSIATRSKVIQLEVIAYAYPSMSTQQQNRVMPLLKSPQFKYDPRDVTNLVYLNAFNKSDLIDLIKDQAYSNKSMSSYMSDATLLGDISYIRTFVNDADDNDKQPTNFYCSTCTLAISTEGLIGEPLLHAVSQGRLKITPQNGLNGEVALLTKGKPTMEWSHE